VAQPLSCQEGQQQAGQQQAGDAGWAEGAWHKRLSGDPRPALPGSVPPSYLLAAVASPVECSALLSSCEPRVSSGGPCDVSPSPLVGWPLGVGTLSGGAWCWAASGERSCLGPAAAGGRAAAVWAGAWCWPLPSSVLSESCGGVICTHAVLRLEKCRAPMRDIWENGL
jgi:hypothetical protein